MADTFFNQLPLIASNQAQKHITHNEALVKVDALIQLAVISQTLTSPPGSPAEGDRYIIASGATGAWAGKDLNIVVWTSGAWAFYAPRPGWVCYVAATANLWAYNGSAWAVVAGGGGGGVTDGDKGDIIVSGSGSVWTIDWISILDSNFRLQDNADTSKVLMFQLSGLTPATTRTLTVPDASGTIALLGTNQTFTGNMTFTGTFAVSAASATLGNSTGASTQNVGTGVTTSGNTKTVNLGTGGASGSTTVVNVGSNTAGALGSLIVNTPTVTFASSVTAIGAAAANISALYLGLGGATADATNRLSINTPAVLLNNAGTSIDMTFNKNAVGNDASLSFKTGFSTRGLVGLLGDDDLTFKVSPNGSTFYTGMIIKASDGRPEFPQPLIIPSQASLPASPASGKLALYARDRAGQTYLDVQRASGRDFPLQPHMGVNRVATWNPSTSTTVTGVGMPVTSVGTVSTPGIASTNLKTSMRRWTLTSAAAVNSVSDQRSAQNVCWRGNAAGLGGWTYTNRLSLTTLQATGMGFFGLYGSTTALATNLLLSALVNCVGIGFQVGTHTNWQLVQNDAAGAPTLTDMGANFPINNTHVLTLFIGAAPNGSSIGVRVVNESNGAVYEATLTTDIPAATTFLSPRNYMNNDVTAAAVAFDCAGVYVETDF